MQDDYDWFELKPDHIRLIRRMNVGYNADTEFGAPEIDPKRPYGNSDVFNDIGEILGIGAKGGDHTDPEYTEEQCAEFLAIHKETATALQVVLSSGSFEPGMYYSKKYHREYKRQGAKD